MKTPTSMTPSSVIGPRHLQLRVGKLGSFNLHFTPNGTSEHNKDILRGIGPSVIGSKFRTKKTKKRSPRDTRGVVVVVNP